MKRFSIIIPCYNSEKTIERCLGCLKNQSFKNFEVIFIDDFSIDNTKHVLTEFIIQNPNIAITLIANKNNIGAGESRNKGFDIVDGEYVLFLDSDDWLENNSLEIINNEILISHPDCIIFDYFLVHGKNKKDKKTVNCKIKNMTPEKFFIFTSGSTMAKVFNFQIIKENNVLFATLRRNEDCPFIKNAVSKCKSIIYLQKPLYNYFNNVNSIMNNQNLLNVKNAYVAFELIENFFKGNKDVLEAVFLKEVLYSVVITNLKLKKNDNEINKEISCIEKRFPNCYRNKYLHLFSLKDRFVIKCIANRKLYIIRFMLKLK